MLVYVLRRLALSLSVIIATVSVTFVLFFVGPNDPAGAMCGTRCTPQRVAQIEDSLGLNQPKIEQYGNYMKGLVAGRDIVNGGFTSHCDAPCLGWSFQQNRSVTTMVMERLPVTASIVLGGAIVYVIVGLLLGVITARARGTFLDRIVVGLSQFVPAIPYYVLALLFYLYLVRLNPILPFTQWVNPLDSPSGWFMGMLGVWVIYGLIASTGYVRYVRSFMINNLSQDFVRTARSKGISERKVVINHALRAAIAPFVTLVGLSMATELSGAIFTERIFQVQGMGMLALNSLTQQDLPVIMGVVIVAAGFVTVANLIVDLIYGLIDPRVKLS